MQKVFVNSLPKSGTHLIAKCLILFGYKERCHIGLGSVQGGNWRSRLRRPLWIKNTGDSYSIGINCPVNVRRWPVDLKLRSLNNNQLITAHVGYNDKLLNSVVQCGIRPMQVIRDPRAVIASFVPYVLNQKKHFAHHAFMEMRPEQQFEAALMGAEFGDIALQPMKDCCLALSSWLEHKRTIVVQFEKLVGSRGGGSDSEMVSTLEHFCAELSLPKNKMVTVIEQLYGPGRHTFRKGRIDSWRSELPRDIIARANIELGDILDMWGYPL